MKKTRQLERRPGGVIRVLQLLQGLAIGGIERMALDLVFHLPESEFQTQFCAFDRQGQLADEVRERGVPLHFRLRRDGIDPGFAVWLAQLVRRERIDIVHAHNATAFFYGAAATSLARRSRFLYTEHDRAFPTPLRERGLHAVLARRTDAVVTVSKTLHDNLIRYECFPAERVHVVKNGVALAPAVRTREAVRAELGLGQRPTAGIIARLADVKNHDLLLRAWKQTIERVPDAILVVVGNGPREADLRAQAARLGLDDHLRFLGFRLDVAELLQSFDVFVLSSFSEGLSLTLLEASAASLPIVATRVGGNPEVVRDGENGFLVESNAEIPMADALARLLQDAALRRRFGARGREFYDAEFTLRAMVQGYERLYHALAGTAPQLSGPDGSVPLAAEVGGRS
jgi:glycosyltransferase involved in cell wall biosynthesis